MGFDEFFDFIYSICPSKGSFGAKLRSGMAAAFVNLLKRRAKVTSQAGSVVVRFEFDEARGLFIAPDMVIVELGSGKKLDDAKKLLDRLTSG